MKRHTIIGMGEIVWDMLPSGKKLGGAPLNFTYYTKEFGNEGFIISAIGDDELGRTTLEEIKRTGINYDYIQKNEYPTGTVDVKLDDKAVPTYNIVESVAWDYIKTDEKSLALVKKADAICWGSLAQRSTDSRSCIQRLVTSTPKDCLKVFDINLRMNYYSKEIIESSLEYTDILKLNYDELSVIAEIFNLKSDDKTVTDYLFSTYGIKIIILTNGEIDSKVFQRNGTTSVIDTPKVNAIDTVGAGDSFTAAFVSSYLNGEDIATCHKKAVEISGYVCTQNGAINPLKDKL